jgi:polar amino acid transport system substrate-binding protein
MLKTLAALLSLSLVTGCVVAPGAADPARAALAPTGTLRAGMNLGNALFTKQDPASGELRGVAVDVMRELAARLGVPLELVVHATPGDVADAVDRGTWDVAILAIEASRAQQIAFSAPITAIEATYMVHGDSPLRSVAQVDAPGVRIVAPEKAGYELYLTRALRHATLLRAKGNAATIALFNARGADALAGLKPTLIEDQARMPGARMLEGTFMTVNHGLGTPRSRDPAAAAWLQAFVEDLRRSGFVARAIERHAVQGLSAVR